MTTFTLQRNNLGTDGPTFGELLDSDGNRLCYTLELPWQDNAPDKSCIMPGTYQVLPNNAEKPWRLERVPGRTQVDIHAGNTVADTEGCILVGTALAPPNAIAHSVDAVNLLKQVLPADNCYLTIYNPPTGGLSL